jgi:hypothetical protein
MCVGLYVNDVTQNKGTLKTKIWYTRLETPEAVHLKLSFLLAITFLCLWLKLRNLHIRDISVRNTRWRRWVRNHGNGICLHYVSFSWVNLYLCFLNQTPRHEDVWRSGRFMTATLDGDEWSAYCPDRFTPGRRPSNKRLGGPQNPSGRCGGEKNLLPLPVIEPRP